MAHSKTTQEQRVLAYIEQFGSITQRDAYLDLGIMRLASRISSLKKKGYPITSRMITVENRFGEKVHIKRYSMRKEEETHGRAPDVCKDYHWQRRIP